MLTRWRFKSRCIKIKRVLGFETLVSSVPNITVWIILLKDDVSMKKLINTLAIVAILALAVLSVSAVVKAAVTPGPAPNSGDGVPSGNQFIQPDTPDSPGPAPNAGDGISDGSGFP